jgi:hypothetical protein
MKDILVLLEYKRGIFQGVRCIVYFPFELLFFSFLQ